MSRFTILALTAGVALAVPGLAGDSKNAADKLKGVYTIVKGENDGKAVLKDKIEGSRVVFTADRIVATDKDKKHLYVATYKLTDTPKSGPWSIEMVIAEGDGRGKKATGIVSVDDEWLRLCYVTDDGKRPEAFTTKEGSKQLCFVLKRLKGESSKEPGGR